MQTPEEQWQEVCWWVIILVLGGILLVVIGHPIISDIIRN